MTYGIYKIGMGCKFEVQFYSSNAWSYWDEQDMRVTRRSGKALLFSGFFLHISTRSRGSHPFIDVYGNGISMVEARA